jgi:hypothetical protein
MAASDRCHGFKAMPDLDQARLAPMYLADARAKMTQGAITFAVGGVIVSIDSWEGFGIVLAASGALLFMYALRQWIKWNEKEKG